MHEWGDSWFQKNGEDLYKAIDKLECRLRKWAKIGVYGKEKYGTYRDEYLRLWDGSLSQIFFGYKIFHGDSWFEKFIYTLDHHLIPYKKTKYGWLYGGLSNLTKFLGITGLVHKWQAKMINKAFQITCKEYPHLVEELIVDTCCYECIKPGKWGNINGTEIHNKYWKTL